LLDKVRNKNVKFIAVVGPSGSGKSSVVQAGLLPRLRRERPPHLSWEAAIFTPGKAPFHNLAAALVIAGTAQQDKWARLGKAEKLGQDLANGVIRLETALATALAETPGANRLLLIVDQAEELFTLIKEQEELFTLTTEQHKEKLSLPPEQDGKLFIQRLMAAAEASPVSIALTLRADFYNQAIGYSRELGELITEGQVNVLPMSRDELRRAIVGPADSVELKFEDGLVDRILDHIEGQPGNLPLLEFALTELWNHKQDKLLTNDAYEAIGRVEGAISRRAEEEFNRLSREQQETAQRVLTRLVRVAAATEEGTDTRQRVRLSEFDRSAQEVVRTFANSRLLVTNRIEIKDEKSGAIQSEEIVEVAHEALICSWQRLKELLNRDRQFLLWRQRLGIARSEWQRTGRDAGALLRGVPLQEARRWNKERASDLNEWEKEFISRSESIERQPKYWIATAATILVVIVLAAVAWKLWDNRPQSQINKILVQSPRLVKIAAATNANIFIDWLNTLTLTGRSEEALETARKIENAGYRSRALANVVEAMGKTGKTEEALEAAREIEDASDRSRALAKVVEAMGKAGKTEEALEAARKIENASDRSRALAKVVEAMGKAGKTEEALEAARKIENASDRSEALINVFEVLAAGRETSGKAKSVIEEAQQAAEQITVETERSRAFGNVAVGLAKLHLYHRARELVDVNNTSAGDKLFAYMAILREHYIENYPDQAKLFEGTRRYQNRDSRAA
jgi:tetratricopeptide (TPR) repeat protein/energy-coupling factor transporter ATP-binding protein EcfA2